MKLFNCSYAIIIFSLALRWKSKSRFASIQKHLQKVNDSVHLFMIEASLCITTICYCELPRITWSNPHSQNWCDSSYFESCLPGNTNFVMLFPLIGMNEDSILDLRCQCIQFGTIDRIRIVMTVSMSSWCSTIVLKQRSTHFVGYIIVTISRY